MHDVIWIVAGNYHEFRTYHIKKKQKGDYRNYRYVYGADQLRGMGNVKGFYVGTYKERKDLVEIQQQIAVINTRNPCSEIMLPSKPLDDDWFKNLYMSEYEATYTNQWTTDSGSNQTT